MNNTRCISLLLLVAAGMWAQGLKEFAIEPVDSMGSHHNTLNDTSITADRILLRDLLAFTYDVPRARVLGPGWLDDAYQVTAKANPGAEDQFIPTLQRNLLERLHLKVERSSSVMPVYVVKLTDPGKLQSSSGASSISGQSGSVQVSNASMSAICNLLTRSFERPVIDETGLEGRYSFDLEWTAGDRESLVKAIRERLGLTLTEDRRKVDVLQVNRN
ncbi:MAG TPA: TIGR03435 family protein [Bryobacteraceae bacterium]|nr:TIGR03435 family protein [Bryobacteraceae bacterium]